MELRVSIAEKHNTYNTLAVFAYDLFQHAEEFLKIRNRPTRQPAPARETLIDHPESRASTSMLAVGLHLSIHPLRRVH